ncbi:galactosylgalactosylxylosylprotein 3-beta-glucuronosyltransferase 1-like, partial [Amphibalanus amphitrite]|uniref:galactosylgalactosylxylosylprotein 3-beta-glucuronosyltransferase 1-like n=1 Tax=Amphibalanus amphitrite TaxID=1232801 RepID=UPI001C913862
MWRRLVRRDIQLNILLLLLLIISALTIFRLNTPQDEAAATIEGPHAGRVRREVSQPEPDSRTVYVITATYPRPEQEADLVRLSQTLMHAKPFLYWIVVEDAPKRTPAVAQLLKRSGLRHVHLLGEPAPVPAKKPRFWGRIPRGVTNRNTGLRWLRKYAASGVVYFADDDNTYDIRLFRE